MNNIEFHGQLKSLTSAVIAFAPMLCGTAWAQSSTASATGATSSGTLEEIVVTATGTSIRGVAPTGSAVVNLSREDLLTEPVRQASEIIARLPQGSNLGFTEAPGGAGNNGRGSGVNLRGLGGNATLVLFDGHRLAGQGIINQFADPNQIPFAAIERVEVVTDGASAIYGSDAVAGVINYIMRRNYQGAEVTARYSKADAGYDTKAVDGVAGYNWDSGNIMFGFTAEKRGAMKRSERAYLMQDLRPYGGNDNRLSGGTNTPGAVGNIVVTNGTVTTVYGIPAGLTSGNPTLAQVQALQGKPNLYDSAYNTDFLPERSRTSGVLSARHKFTDTFEVTYTGLASKRDTRFEQLTPVSLTILPAAGGNAASPYYIPGISTSGGSYSVTYNPTLNGNPNIQEPYENVVNHTLDFKLDLFREWQLNASLVRGKTTGCGVCGDENNNTFPTAYSAPNATNGFSTTDAALLNPYIAGTQPGIFRAVGQTFQEAELNLKDAAVRFDGPLLSLPAGALRASIGGEYSYSDHHLMLKQNIRNYTNTMQVIRDSGIDRTIRSVFVEAFVPLFGAQNARTGLQRLDLSLAVRSDDYSDFGKTTNPKYGLTWKPIQSLDLRGSWGTSFRAPTLTESNPGTITLLTRQNFTNGSGDPAIPVTNTANGTSYVMQRVGNTKGLKPETATVWSFGFDWEPEFLEGLRLSGTYYSVYYQDRIEAVPNAASSLATPANRALYAPFIVPAPQPSTCVAGNVATYNPVYQALFAVPFSNNLGSPLQDCTLTAYVEAGQQNLGDLDQRGIDLSVMYDFDTAIGHFQTGAAVSKLLKLDKAFVPGGPMNDVLNTIGFQVGTRGNATVDWAKGRWSANFKANYIGSYLNNTPITVNGVRLPNSNVPSWTTLDAGVAYAIPDDAVEGWMSGVRIAFSVQNLTNDDPPIVLNGVNATDNANSNPYGRILGMEVTKRF